MFQCEAGEPTEGDRASAKERHEARRKHGALHGVDREGVDVRQYCELQGPGGRAPAALGHGVSDGAQVRVYEVEREAQALDAPLLVGSEEPRRGGGVGRHHVVHRPTRRRGIRRTRYQIGDVDGEIGKQTTEVPPSPREGADPDGGARVEELEDGEQDVVGERAQPVVVMLGSFLHPFALLNSRR